MGNCFKLCFRPILSSASCLPIFFRLHSGPQQSLSPLFFFSPGANRGDGRERHGKLDWRPCYLRDACPPSNSCKSSGKSLSSFSFCVSSLCLSPVSGSNYIPPKGVSHPAEKPDMLLCTATQFTVCTHVHNVRCCGDRKLVSCFNPDNQGGGWKRTGRLGASEDAVEGSTSIG